jgi:threonine aldolase
VLVYEMGGPAIHSGLVMRGIRADGGIVTAEDVASEPELGPDGIVVLENTHRSAGGCVWPLDAFEATIAAARERGAAVHLDGARLFNASVAASAPPAAWASLADSVTLCFSKGLGCPLGAVVAGSRELIERAWEGKFLFGGAMRQAGVIAAAALYALDHHVERLAEDHARAQRLAAALGLAAETNFVAIDDPGDGVARAREHGVLLGDLRPGVLRAVTHMDVSDDDIEQAAEILPRALGLRVHA